MGDIIETIYMAVISTASLCFFLGVGAYILYASGSRWREYEALYAFGERGEPIAKKTTGAVRVTQPGFRFGHLSGDMKSRFHPPVEVGIYPDGLSLSITNPFKYGCGDLFLPFDKMTIEPTFWGVIKNPYGVQMEGVEGIEICMYDDIIKWAAEHAEVVGLMARRADILRSETALEA